MEQLKKLYCKLGNISNTELSFEQVYYQCFEKVKHKLIRLKSQKIENNEQLVNASVSKSINVYNLVDKLQPSLLPIHEWPSKSSSETIVEIMQCEYKQHEIANPLSILSVIKNETINIKDLNNKFCKYYKNKESSIPLPSLHNTEEELQCIKQLLYSWLSNKLLKKNKKDRYVCYYVIYIICSNYIFNIYYIF